MYIGRLAEIQNHRLFGNRPSNTKISPNPMSLKLRSRTKSIDHLFPVLMSPNQPNTPISEINSPGFNHPLLLEPELDPTLKQLK